ncbi:hypothetical protein I5G04_28170 [Pseudomonas aeruginosa]|nr:hypothetical protein [Pseudomonas aeruginosa]EKV3077008.1 hypothetical protein [Pseudomonas aeruginosa]EKW2598516.1 hypothetical protein [Pseudomonas aeruginosa]EME5141364.1 hypothetical protein [Pseudomonas aeruginosa]KSM97173.1 hypothetical protein APA82_21505 [Pseudomonas aeruginosa]
MDDVAQAGVALPGERELLLTTYDMAFRRVLYVLAAASALTALLVFTLLGRSHAHDEAKDKRA